MDETCKPFRFTRCLCINGGLLKKPLVLDTISIAGEDYVTVKRTNRELAKALGLSMGSDPFADTTVFNEIAKLRDDAIDELIATYDKEQDPMGEITETRVICKRPAKMMGANVPQTICVKYPAFVGENGKRIPEQGIHVLTATN